MIEKKAEEHILKATSVGRIGGRGRARGRGGRGRGRQAFRKEAIESYHSHKLGHFQYEFPNWDEKVNNAEFGEEEEVVLMAYNEEEQERFQMSYGDAKDDAIGNVWFLDSGCSNHMYGHRDWFVEMNEQIKVPERLGNHSRLMTAGKGTVKLKVGELTHRVADVYYVPELKSNLLSIGQLQEKGLTFVFKNKFCKV